MEMRTDCTGSEVPFLSFAARFRPLTTAARSVRPAYLESAILLSLGLGRGEELRDEGALVPPPLLLLSLVGRPLRRADSVGLLVEELMTLTPARARAISSSAAPATSKAEASCNDWICVAKIDPRPVCWAVAQGQPSKEGIVWISAVLTPSLLRKGGRVASVAAELWRDAR